MHHPQSTLLKYSTHGIESLSSNYFVQPFENRFSLTSSKIIGFIVILHWRSIYISFDKVSKQNAQTAHTVCLFLAHEIFVSSLLEKKLFLFDETMCQVS